MTCYSSPKNPIHKADRRLVASGGGKPAHHEEDWEEKRNLRHRHNGFLGCCSMQRKQLQSIIDSTSICEDTRQHALDMLDEVATLEKLLRLKRIGC